MVIVMETDATTDDLDRVVAEARQRGLRVRIGTTTDRTILQSIDGTRSEDLDALRALGGVATVYQTSVAYELASRMMCATGTAVPIGDVAVGGRDLVVMARAARRSGATPWADLSGLRKLGVQIVCRPASMMSDPLIIGARDACAELALWHAVAAAEGIKVVAEVADVATIEWAAAYADAYEVGACNMQNFVLLRELGRCRIPVLLNRSISGTVEEWLLAAEYVLVGGNPHVILCERGIRTFDRSCDTLDLGAVSVVKHESHLPVVVDPGDAVPHARHMAAMARAAIAAGADGLLLPIRSERSGSGEAPGLDAREFAGVQAELAGIGRVLGRSLAAAVTT